MAQEGFSDVELVTRVITKTQEGNAESKNLGVFFNNVIEKNKECTLEQFYKNYKNFINNNIFTYVGMNEPTNPNVGIWIEQLDNPSICNW